MQAKQAFIGELLGAFVLVLFGCGSVAVTVLFGAHQGLMQVALAWGIGVTLAIYLSRGLSGAHLNPAVSVAMTVAGRLPAKRLPIYIGAQLIGAVTAGCVVYLLFGPSIAAFETAHGIVRGSPASVQTAAMFGEFYPNPGVKAVVTLPLAMAAEGFGAFLLVLLVLALTESANEGRPDGAFAPVLIGSTITSLICLIAPLTQCGINPARDFGPRMVAAVAGWGAAAFPDRVGGFFHVYIFAPIVGGCLAALLFVKVLEPTMKSKQNEPQPSDPLGPIVTTMKTKLIFVGGFLGAGKTTLLAETARVLAARGKRVGLITNDQAPELVDTAFLSGGEAGVAEVSGSCFCCNFAGLLNAMAQLRSSAHADVLLAEPVGSCTDLSATIVQPLKERHNGDLDVSPLSVLADPERLAGILDGGSAGLHPSAAYIYRKQLEEADVIVVTKSDTVEKSKLDDLVVRTARMYPLASVMSVSAKTGQGLAAWLDEVLTRSDAGNQIAEVDYDTYAEGEAVLGWLNATFILSGADVSWTIVMEDILSTLGDRFDSLNASVGHVKLLIQDGSDSVIGNLTGTRETLSVRGPRLGGPTVRLTLNARVEMSPSTLEQIVRDALAALAEGNIAVDTVAWRCLSPGRPTPTYRYDHLVPIA